MNNLTRKILSPRNLGAVIAILVVGGAAAYAQIPAYKSWLANGANLYALGALVGIGISNPSAPLHIETPTGGAAVLIRRSDTTQDVRLGFHASSGKAALQAGVFGLPGTTLLINPDGGPVGINTPAPGAQLELVGSAEATLRLRKTVGAPGSMNLFPAVGDGIARTGPALCQTVALTAACLAYWSSAGAFIGTPSGGCNAFTSVPFGRALCADFGD